ncbi:hypothetical protein ACFLWB_00005 [Chloroflexota bacterium]
MFRFFVGRKCVKHLVVDDTTHVLVRAYAQREGITTVEATYNLLRIGFAVEEMGMVPASRFDPRRTKSLWEDILRVRKELMRKKIIRPKREDLGL